MSISLNADSFDLLRWILLAAVLLPQFGCGTSPTSPAASSMETPPAEARGGTQLASSLEVIVALTPRSAAELRKYLERADTSATIFIAVSVENNCRGFRYELEVRDSLEGENVILTSCEGIPLAIDRDDAAFLKGTTLDYVDDPKGLQFKASHVDTMLLAEYRAKRDEEERMRPIEEAKAKLIIESQAA
jgi:Fe-S cluster assembly iron-binding protein IscA